MQKVFENSGLSPLCATIPLTAVSASLFRVHNALDVHITERQSIFQSAFFLVVGGGLFSRAMPLNPLESGAINSLTLSKSYASQTLEGLCTVYERS